MKRKNKRTFFGIAILIIVLIVISIYLSKNELLQSEIQTNSDPDDITNMNTVKWSHPSNQQGSGQIYLDENGVPYYDYQTILDEYIGKQRNPVIIYRVANEFYNDFLETGNNTSKQIFLNNANWLIENTINHVNYSIFEFAYPHPNYHLPSGWHDAMGQAKIINLMLKSHNLTGDERYLEKAKLLSNAFYVDITEGGLAYKTTNNGWWYEHYAHKDGLHPRVLNGMMFTLLDINALYEYTNDPNAKFLFDQGIISLKHDLKNYDFFGYTYYDIIKGSTSYSYHKIHVQQTKLLYDITNDNFFLEYHNKWKSCEESCHFILKHVALFLREIQEIPMIFTK